MMHFKPQQRLNNISLNKRYWPEKFSVHYLNLKDNERNDLAIFEGDYNKLKAYLLEHSIEFEKLSRAEKYQLVALSGMKVIKYFSPENLAQHELDITHSSFQTGGNISSQSGSLLKKEGHQNCVVLHHGKIYIHPKIRSIPGDILPEHHESPAGLIGVSHSSLSSGADVPFAGSFIHTVEQGWILENTTGHYGTRAQQLILMLDVLARKRVNLSHLTVRTWVPKQPHLQPPSPHEADYDIHFENAAELLNRVKKSNDMIDKQRLETKKIKGYRAALQSPELDSSDYILLVTAILSEKLGPKHPDLIQIKSYYFHHQYKDAMRLLDALCEHEVQTVNPALYSEILKKTAIINDSALRNNSRRYFDTKISACMIKNLSAIDYANVAHFNEFLKQYIPTGFNIEMNDTIDSFSDIKQVFSSMRKIADANNMILTGHDRFRESSMLYRTKDRGKQIAEQQNLLSMSPGVMKSTSSVPFDELVKPQMNRTPDLFTILDKTDGFSSTAPYAPFVNSLSGTAYTLVYMLKLYMEQNSDAPHLEKNIISLLTTWLSLTCNGGYHGFYEMMAVFSDPVVISIFDAHHIELDLSHVADHVLDEAFDSTVAYETVSGQKRSLFSAIEERRLKSNEPWEEDDDKDQTVVKKHSTAQPYCVMFKPKPLPHDPSKEMKTCQINPIQRQLTCGLLDVIDSRSWYVPYLKI